MWGGGCQVPLAECCSKVGDALAGHGGLWHIGRSLFEEESNETACDE